mmetsp:Transcript_9663/g.17413  ORF Transcript_9663/g.17413 Transcript_9663/m.17413 type:complete len:526 (-) Transcript_9663:70-1647(-)
MQRESQSLIKTHQRFNSCTIKRVIRIISFVILLLLFLTLYQNNSKDAFYSLNFNRNTRIRTQKDSTIKLNAVWMSDIHLEPFFCSSEYPQYPDYICRDNVFSLNCSNSVDSSLSSGLDCCTNQNPAEYTYFGRLNCDTKPNLFFTQLHSIQKQIQNINLILLSGDFVAHSFKCKSHSIDTLKYVTTQIQNTFPNTTVLFTLGNVDVFPANHIEVEDHQLPLLFEHFVSIHWLKAAHRMSFQLGGYYAIDLGFDLVGISINTNFLVQNHHEAEDKCESRPTDPAGMFAWMKHELIQSRKLSKQVIVIGHAAPGMKEQKMDWCDDYVALYSSICEQFSDQIIAQFFGDFNRDEIRLLSTNSDFSGSLNHSSVMLINPGTTPRRPSSPGANPIHKHVVFSTEPKESNTNVSKVDLEQVITYWFPIERMNRIVSHSNSTDLLWSRLYSTRSDYGMSRVNVETVQKWMLAMESNLTELEKYIRFQSANAIGNREYTEYLCDMKYTVYKDRLKCVQSLNLSYSGSYSSSSR